MAGKVVGWAFEIGRTENLSATQRFVLVAYADNASEKEGKCWPEKPEIIEKTGLSRATVYRAVRALEAGGHLSETADEKGRECIFLAVPWASHGETDESHGENEAAEAVSQPETRDSQGETPASHSETGTNKGTVKNRQEPSHSRSGGDRGKVAGKKVTGAEYALATEIIAAFNQAAGSQVTVDAHLSPVVGRIRQRPDLTAEDHRCIIASVFAVPWWSGAPGPAVIYGNAEIFERSLETWRAAPRHLRVVEPAPPAEEIGAGREELAAAWTAIAEKIEAAIPAWLLPIEPAGLYADIAYFSATAHAGWLNRRYHLLVAEALSEPLGHDVRVRFIAAGEAAA